VSTIHPPGRGGIFHNASWSGLPPRPFANGPYLKKRNSPYKPKRPAELPAPEIIQKPVSLRESDRKDWCGYCNEKSYFRRSPSPLHPDEWSCVRCNWSKTFKRENVKVPMGQESIFAAAAGYMDAHNRLEENPSKPPGMSTERVQALRKYDEAQALLFQAVDAFLSIPVDPTVSAAIRFRRAHAKAIKRLGRSRSPLKKKADLAMAVGYLDSQKAFFDAIRHSTLD